MFLNKLKLAVEYGQKTSNLKLLSREEISHYNNNDILYDRTQRASRKCANQRQQWRATRSHAQCVSVSDREMSLAPEVRTRNAKFVIKLIVFP